MSGSILQTAIAEGSCSASVFDTEQAVPVAPPELRCDKCSATFTSRNKLFKHLVANDSCGGKAVLGKQLAPTEKVVLLYGYIGTNYSGNTRQSTTDTTLSVEGRLWEAIDLARGHSGRSEGASPLGSFSAGSSVNPPGFSTASRTDKGVHALTNIVCLSIETLPPVSPEEHAPERAREHAEPHNPTGGTERLGAPDLNRNSGAAPEEPARAAAGTGAGARAEAGTEAGVGAGAVSVIHRQADSEAAPTEANEQHETRIGTAMDSPLGQGTTPTGGHDERSSNHAVPGNLNRDKVMDYVDVDDTDGDSDGRSTGVSAEHGPGSGGGKPRSSEDRFVAAVNAQLPEDIHVIARILVRNNEFHARRFCERRRYEYLVPYHAFRPPYVARIAGEGVVGGQQMIWPEEVWDEGSEHEWGRMHTRRRIKKIMNQFGGTHCFHNYTKRDHEFLQVTDCYRHITRFYCRGTVWIAGTPFCLLSVQGKSFLYHQIRKMVGMVIAIARGSLPQQTVGLSLDPTHVVDVPTAPGSNLYLVHCVFFSFVSKRKHPPFEPTTEHDLARLRQFREKIHRHIGGLEGAAAGQPAGLEGVTRKWLGTMDVVGWSHEL